MSVDLRLSGGTVATPSGSVEADLLARAATTAD